MYQRLKLILKAILPGHLLLRYELLFRYFYYLFFIGKKYQCSVCSKKLSGFTHSNTNLICPACGSASRNRRLWLLLKNEFLKENSKLLHFSPSRSLYRKLRTQTSINYTATDFSGEFFADKKLDITAIDEQSNSYDLVICYHVLEHVENDQKAMAELYRILKSGGYCLIQTPFKEGNIFEDLTIKNPGERLLKFGQEDHVRIYSVSGLKERLCYAGFSVEIREFAEEDDNYFGLKQKEIVLIAKK